MLRLRSWLKQFDANAEPDNPEKQAESRKAQADCDEFAQDQEAQKEVDKKTDWDLSKDEEKELKKLYRKACRLCHPDMVAPEHIEAASKMFIQLKDAYETGDLKRVRKIASQVKAGLFEADDSPGRTDEERKENLCARIAAMREALEKGRADLDAMTNSSTYQTASESEDWEEYFEERAQLLDAEIETLEEEVIANQAPQNE